MDLRSLSEDAPESQWGSLCATRSVPSSSSRSITAQRRQADQIVVPKVSGRRRQAADGQQPVSVTTGECARKPWRIMTADLWHRWPLTWRSSHAFTILNTTQFHVPYSVQISHGGSQRFKPPHLYSTDRPHCRGPH